MAKKKPVPLSARLKAARKTAGLSQQALADAVGLHRTSIARMESGAIEPSLPSLRDLARATGVSLGSLLDPESEE